MKKPVLGIAAGVCAFIASASAALACDIEDMSYRTEHGYIIITGAMSCPSGRIDYRLYDGDEKFVTAGSTFFQGHVLQIMERGDGPPSISIRYTITER